MKYRPSSGYALVSVCLSHNLSCCEIVWIKHVLSWMIHEGCKTPLAFTCHLSSFVRKGIRLGCKELCLQNLQIIFSNMKYSFFVRSSLNLCPVMQIQIWVCETENKRKGKSGPFFWISPFSFCYWKYVEIQNRLINTAFVNCFSCIWRLKNHKKRKWGREEKFDSGMSSVKTKGAFSSCPFHELQMEVTRLPESLQSILIRLNSGMEDGRDGNGCEISFFFIYLQRWRESLMLDQTGCERIKNACTVFTLS